MKIALVTEFSIPHYAGGGERRYFEIAKRLAKKHEVTWITMKQKDSPKVEHIEGVRVLHIGSRIRNLPNRSILDFLRYMMAVFFHLISHRYDIVDAQPFSPLLPSWLACTLMFRPMVATIYDVESDTEGQWLEKGKIAKMAEKILYRLPYKTVVTISDSVLGVLVKKYRIAPKRMKLVYCGTDIKKIDAVKKQKQTTDLIFVGRLVPHKNAEDFIELVSRIKKRQKAIKATIIGQGPLEKNIKQSIKQKGLKSNIRFLGKLESYSAVLKEIKKSKILVLPSQREGFGMVLTEAGAAGIPVVAYECNGVVDVVDRGVTGYLVPQKDLNALESVVSRLLKSKKLRDDMGRAGRKRVKKLFTWEINVKKLEQIYKRISK
ncbi:glycosyltransferase family 4 protein [Candidatus Woesearchaeota archaeon]|nr:glycosyltransferase family 4 protein [Candidatus Woesearchaeota archaeon]